jgi:hypothetical protein
MLYVVLFLAVVFYASLFLVWGTLGPQLDSAAMRFSFWREVIFSVPDQTSLLLLKELIVLTLVYVVFDAVIAAVRRALERRTPRPSWHDYPSASSNDSLIL